MFVASLASLLLTVKTCFDGSVIRSDQQCFLFDHRNQISLSPETTTQTVEWRCERRSAKAQVRIVEMPFKNERGEPVSKHLFKVELLELRLDGDPASKESHDRVRAALAPLNNVAQLHGKCFREVPALNIVGHSLSDPPRQQRRVEIELK